MATGGAGPRKGVTASREDVTAGGEADSAAQRRLGPSREPDDDKAHERWGRKLSITDGRHTPKEEEAQEGNGRGEALTGLFIANGFGRCENP
jgi:hypothetical protein